MFFRREKLKEPAFNERLDKLKDFGFVVEHLAAGKAKVVRNGIAALVEDIPGQRPHVNKAGWILGNEIGLLVNGGYQMFWRTPSGRRMPAQAAQLKELHA